MAKVDHVLHSSDMSFSASHRSFNSPTLYSPSYSLFLTHCIPIHSHSTLSLPTLSSPLTSFLIPLSHRLSHLFLYPAPSPLILSSHPLFPPSSRTLLQPSPLCYTQGVQLAMRQLFSDPVNGLYANGRTSYGPAPPGPLGKTAMCVIEVAFEVVWCVAFLICCRCFDQRHWLSILLM
jgi:hypothetical protein